MGLWLGMATASLCSPAMGVSAVTPDEFAAVYPVVLYWMRQTIAEHEDSAKIVAVRGFKRSAVVFFTRTTEHDESRFHQPSSDPTTVINGDCIVLEILSAVISTALLI